MGGGGSTGGGVGAAASGADMAAEAALVKGLESRQSTLPVECSTMLECSAACARLLPCPPARPAPGGAQHRRLLAGGGASGGSGLGEPLALPWLLGRRKPLLLRTPCKASSSLPGGARAKPAPVSLLPASQAGPASSPLPAPACPGCALRSCCSCWTGAYSAVRPSRAAALEQSSSCCRHVAALGAAAAGSASSWCSAARADSASCRLLGPSEGSTSRQGVPAASPALTGMSSAESGGRGTSST